MHARVGVYKGTPEQTEEGLRNFREKTTEQLRQLDGFEGAYLLADREGGKALTITLWASESAAEASAEQAKQMRSQAAEGAGMTVESVETYEVALKI